MELFGEHSLTGGNSERSCVGASSVQLKIPLNRAFK